MVDLEVILDLTMTVCKSYRFETKLLSTSTIARSILFGGAHGFDVQADPFTVAAVIVLIENAYLVECAAQVCRAERLVLIVFGAILIVQVHGHEFAQRHDECHVVRWV